MQIQVKRFRGALLPLSYRCTCSALPLGHTVEYTRQLNLNSPCSRPIVKAEPGKAGEARLCKRRQRGPHGRTARTAARAGGGSASTAQRPGKRSPQAGLCGSPRIDSATSAQMYWIVMSSIVPKPPTELRATPFPYPIEAVDSTEAVESAPDTHATALWVRIAAWCRL